jgi:hypothetical protein
MRFCRIPCRSWILPESEYLFYPFALVMPALVYCGIRIASMLLPVPRPVDIGGTVAGLVGDSGSPGFWFYRRPSVVRLPTFMIAVLFRRFHNACAIAVCPRDYHACPSCLVEAPHPAIWIIAVAGWFGRPDRRASVESYHSVSLRLPISRMFIPSPYSMDCCF